MTAVRSKKGRGNHNTSEGTCCGREGINMKSIAEGGSKVRQMARQAEKGEKTGRGRGRDVTPLSGA